MSKPWIRPNSNKPIRNIEFPNRRLNVDICKEVSKDKFNASFKLSAFNKESSIEIILSDELKNITQRQDVLTLNDIHKIYHRNNDNEFEWEMEFTEKPLTNRFNFTINLENFDARYQPETILKRDRESGKIICDDNVLGSYAIYHKTKKNNAYKTGKAFHIYRPEAIDSLGDRVWCDLLIDEENNLLSITIPQSFLDNALYPVILDPTIGYETNGAIWAAAGDIVHYYKITMTEAGTLTDIHSRTSSNESPTVYSGIYDDDSGDPGDLLEEETTGYTAANWADGGAWHEMSMAGTLSLSNSTSYWIAINGDSTTTGGLRVHGDYNKWHYANHATEAGTSLPDPSGASSTASGADYDINLYITYTTGGGTAHERTCDESISVTDSDKLDSGKIIDDNTSISDGILKVLAITAGDDVNVSDIKQLIISKNLASEAVSISTHVSKELFKQLYEYIIITDLSTKIYNKLVDDDITTTDSILTETAGLVLRVVTELISIADSTKNNINKIASDSVNVVDSIIAQRLGALIERIVAEAITVSDQVTTEIFVERLLTELITITDSLAPHEMHKVINQNINVDDFIKKYLHRQLQDGITVTDTATGTIVGIVLATLIRLQSINITAGSELKSVSISCNGSLKDIQIIGG